MADALLAARRKIRSLARRDRHAHNRLTWNLDDKLHVRLRRRIDRQFKAACAVIERLRKARGLTRAEPWWPRVADPWICARHTEPAFDLAFLATKTYGSKVMREYQITPVEPPKKTCKGTLRCAPWSGPGWTVILCTHCNFHAEM